MTDSIWVSPSSSYKSFLLPALCCWTPKCFGKQCECPFIQLLRRRGGSLWVLLSCDKVRGECRIFPNISLNHTSAAHKQVRYPGSWQHLSGLPQFVSLQHHDFTRRQKASFMCGFGLFGQLDRTNRVIGGWHFNVTWWLDLNTFPSALVAVAAPGMDAMDDVNLWDHTTEVMNFSFWAALLRNYISAKWSNIFPLM